ncbi:MAG: sulfite exporter TauE/SafE family protein [Actinomycetota bacterium]
MTFDLGELSIILAAMVVGGFVKGATGLGLPPIAIPVMASFLGVEHAVVVMAIPGVVSNAWLLWIYRNHLHRTRDLLRMLVTGVFGSVAGTTLLTTLDDSVLSLVLASVICLYVIVFLAHPNFSLRPAVTRYSSPPVGLAAGLLQGSTGVSGPLLSTYMHALRLDKEAYVLSVTTVFLVFSVVQIAAFTILGLYTEDRLAESLLALAPIMIMLQIGTRVTQGLSRRAFDLMILAVLIGSGARLVYGALT